MARLSEIIGSGFFNIKLDPVDYERVDSALLAANHHYWMASNKHLDEPTREFHKLWFLKNVRELHTIISMGDFSKVAPLPVILKFGFNKPQTWASRLPPVNPDKDTLAQDINVMCHKYLYDPELFINMCSDIRWGAKQNHPYDRLLTNSSLQPSDINLDAA